MVLERGRPATVATCPISFHPPLQALLHTWRSSSIALWQPALLSLCAAALFVWEAMDAALAMRQDGRGSSGGEGSGTQPAPAWLAAHLAACNVALLSCAAAAALVAAISLAAASARGIKAQSDLLAAPLLSDAERGGSTGPRWRLIYGVSFYVWPDKLGLQLR